MTPVPPGNLPYPPNALQLQYDTLQAAIASGVRTVRFQDRTIEYATTDEMIKAANYIAGKLGIGGVRQIRFYTRKGL